MARRRQRLIEIFGPEGFHAEQEEKTEVWNEFIDLLDHLPEHKLASIWERKFGDRFPNYNGLLGPQSLRTDE